MVVYEPGDVVAYDHDSGTQLGLVLDVTQDSLYLQQYEPRKSVYTTWVLLWENIVNDTRYSRNPTQPNGFIRASSMVARQWKGKDHGRQMSSLQSLKGGER